DRRGTSAIEHPPSRPDAERQFRQRYELFLQSHAIQSADLDPLDRKAFGRDKLGFQPAPCSDETHSVTSGAQLSRHGQSRNHMPTRASTGDDEGGRFGGYGHPS